LVAIIVAIAALNGCGTRSSLAPATITPQAAKRPFLHQGFRFLRDMSAPNDVTESDDLLTARGQGKSPVGGITIYRTITQAQRACAPSRRYFCGSPVYRVRNVTMAPDPAWSTPAVRNRLLTALRTLGTPVRIK
jgi:hypothetical protein